MKIFIKLLLFSMTQLGITYIKTHDMTTGRYRDESDYGGYSYHKFSGPVTGEIHQISVPRGYYKQGAGQAEQAIDYVAKPNYNYVYGVEDPHTGNVQSHQESRDGDAVIGQYSVMEPDGSMRIVKYTADDKNGFQVHVEYVKPEQQQEV